MMNINPAMAALQGFFYRVKVLRMLMLISPAKTLNETPMERLVAATPPRFWKEAQELAAVLRGYSPEQLGALMDISPKLAALNVERYAHFPTAPDARNAKPALFAFEGDVYRPIHAKTYDEATLMFASKHVRILSGLYGLLRPLDYLYPYRLEMGTRLPTTQGNTLYQFWGEKITRAIAKDVAVSGTAEVLNLASEEYSKAVQPEKLKGVRVITVEFREKKGNTFPIVGVHAKHARGLMVDYVLRNRIAYAEGIEGFNREGYRFAAAMSDTHRFVFTRKASEKEAP
jgi:hypothetical protein